MIDRTDAGVAVAVCRYPHFRAAPHITAGGCHPNLRFAACQLQRCFENNGRVGVTRRNVVVCRIAQRRLRRIFRRRVNADGVVFSLDGQDAFFVFFDFSNADGGFIQSKPCICQGYDVHRFKQAVFPTQLKLIFVTDVKGALQELLRHLLRYLAVANTVHLYCVFRAQSVLLDVRLVFHFRDGDVVVVVTVEILDLDLIKRVSIGFTLNVYRVFRARNDKVVIGQVVDGFVVGNIDRTVARIITVAVGDDFQTTLRKHRRAIGLLQQFRNVPLRLALFRVGRA